MTPDSYQADLGVLGRADGRETSGDLRVWPRARRRLITSGTVEGYTWHGNRHTFASRLVMAGVDLLTVQTLEGWRTPAMVQRYAHLAPEYLARAVERLVAPRAAVELGRNMDAAGVVERVAP